jgi:hypothetical protein
VVKATTGTQQQHETRSATPPERSLALAGSTIKARYRVNNLSSVSRELAVYSAEDVRYGRPVLVKVLREEVAADADFVAAVRDRASTLAMFAHLHRGVARVYECDATDTGEPFVAVERTTGVTLREILNARAPLDPPLALRIATRVGEALEALHHNHIVHGELTPDAVVMVPTAGGTEHVTLVGVELTAAYRTPIGARVRDASHLAYRAPEQDEHALGVLLREMVTADGTAAGRTAPPMLPPTIDRIIVTALEPRPELRYADISVMINDMWGAHTMLAEPELRVRSAKLQPSGHRRRRRGRLRSPLRIATGVVMAALLGGVVWVATDRIVARSRAAVSAPAPAPVAVEPAATPPAAGPVASELAVAPPAATATGEKATGEKNAAPASVTVPPAPPKRPATERPVGAAKPTVAERPATPRPAPDRPAVTERPTPAIERSPVERSERAAAPVDRPRRSAESSTPAERPSPRTDAEDGSGAIDWLLQNRR